MNYRKITIEDYEKIMDLWNSVEMTKKALNPVDDSRDGIARYLKRNPDTCFAAVNDDGELCGVILSGHDGRRGIVHHLCVSPKFQRQGIASELVSLAESALKQEGIQKIFILAFKENEKANDFWQAKGYSLRTNLNYRNKSLSEEIPQGE
ncbi:MAG: GNAT family N-acetyltransferase [Treponema sp.]